MKKMYAVVFLVVAGGLVYALGSYHMVRTPNGTEFVKKKEFGFDRTIVDTRDWAPADWLKNKDISLALAQDKLTDLKDAISEGWNDFSKEVESRIDSLNLKDKGQDAEDKLSDLRKDAKKQYDKLVKRLKDNDIDRDTFDQKIKELKAWVDRQVKDLEKRFE